MFDELIANCNNYFDPIKQEEEKDNYCYKCKNGNLIFDSDYGLLICKKCGSIINDKILINEFDKNKYNKRYIPYSCFLNLIKALSRDVNVIEYKKDLKLYVDAFFEIKDPKRHNIQRKNYIFHKILQRNGVENKQYTFSTKKLIYQNEKMWERICNRNGWLYINDMELFDITYKKHIKKNKK